MSSADDTLDRMLRAIADASRRRILRTLEAGEGVAGRPAGLCASEIEMRIGLSQPTVSHHMSILVKAGLVEARKMGRWRWYCRNEVALREFSSKLRDSL